MRSSRCHILGRSWGAWLASGGYETRVARVGLGGVVVRRLGEGEGGGAQDVFRPEPPVGQPLLAEQRELVPAQQLHERRARVRVGGDDAGLDLAAVAGGNAGGAAALGEDGGGGGVVGGGGAG